MNYDVVGILDQWQIPPHSQSEAYHERAHYRFRPRLHESALWQARENQSGSLNEYIERKFLSKITAIEQRLGLIRKHYYPADPSGITDRQLLLLRRLMTTDHPSATSRESRTVAIHALIADMVGNLLE